MALQAVRTGSVEEAVAAYRDGRCTALTADHSALYAIRRGLPRPQDHTVLPEILARKPLGLVVRRGDEAWREVVRWVHYALVAGEELGVTAAGVEAMRSSSDQEVRALLGADSALGALLGLDDDWAAQALSAVGNYSEIFARNLGAGTDLGMARGHNALWRDGGLLFAPPIR